MEQTSLNPLNFTLFRTDRGPVRADSIPYFLVHLSPIAAFFVDFHWSLVALALGSYFLRMFFTTGFLHRYFSHKSFRIPSRFVQFIIAFLSSTAIQKGCLWWASHHRHHHRYSDTEGDLHSPSKTGFWHSHFLWVLTLDANPDYKQRELKDFENFPELKWIDQYYWVAAVVYGAILTAIGGLPWLVWGLFISQVLLWHGTYTINSLSHVFGNARYATTDTSKNNWLLAIVTLGEGWHNNHHYYQSASRCGFYWYEIDITYYILLGMEKLGLIADLRQPSERVLTLGREIDAERNRVREFVRPGILRRLTVAEIRSLAAAIEKLVDRHRLRKFDLSEVRRFIAMHSSQTFVPA